MYDDISAEPELSIFVKALKAVDMVSTLRKSKDLTVFAPTNSIFEKLMEEMTFLFTDRASIIAFLKRRIIPKRLKIADLKDGVTQEKSIHDTPMNITINGKEILTETIENESRITIADISVRNGNINMIDTMI